MKWFEENRKEKVEAVKSYEDLQRVIVHGQVKTGKRELCIIETKRRGGVDSQGRENKFILITSLGRKDTKSQLEELRGYEMDCEVVASKKDVDRIFEKVLISAEADDSLLTIYVDEGDYGSSEKQLLKKLFEKIYNGLYKIQKSSGKKQIFLRFYTATPEELTHSKCANNCSYVFVEPGIDYRGGSWLLQKNLVVEAEPFFEFDEFNNVIISQQGLDMLEKWKSNSKKPFSIVRVSSKSKDLPNFKQVSENKELRDFLVDKFSVKIVEVDEKRSLDWGYQEHGRHHWSDHYGHPLKTIFLINQTCTRSTEIRFHPLIFAFHDYHSKNTSYNTYAQSSLRIAHYKYNEEVKIGSKILWTATESDIMLYSSVNCIKLESKQITTKEFKNLEPTRRLSSRVSKSVNFKATNEMIEARNIEFIDIPEDVLKDSLKNFDHNKLKHQYPSISNWLKNGIDDGACRVREEFDRSYSKLAKRNDIFYRALGANVAVNIAESLIKHTHHTAMAPIFIDKFHPNYEEDWNKLLLKYPGCLHKIALIILSEDEIKAREQHDEKYNTSENSMYESEVLSLVGADRGVD